MVVFNLKLPKSSGTLDESAHNLDEDKCTKCDSYGTYDCAKRSVWATDIPALINAVPLLICPASIAIPDCADAKTAVPATTICSHSLQRSFSLS